MHTEAAQLKFTLFEQAVLAPLGDRKLTESEAFVASFLLPARTQDPFTLDQIAEALTEHNGGARTGERTIKSIIRSLRKVHGFPVLSRKHPPHGYWWGQSADEMKEFVREFRSQPMDELHTLSVMVKRNYPDLVGQLKFEEVT